MVVITLSARLCFTLVRVPYFLRRSVVAMSDLPSGVSNSLMWFIPRLHRSLTLFGACRMGYGFVCPCPMFGGLGIHGRSGMLYAWSCPLWIVIPECLAMIACLIRKAYRGNQSR